MRGSEWPYQLYERYGFSRSNEKPDDLFGTPLLTMVKNLPAAKVASYDAGTTMRITRVTIQLGSFERR